MNELVKIVRTIVLGFRVLIGGFLILVCTPMAMFAAWDGMWDTAAICVVLAVVGGAGVAMFASDLRGMKS